MTDEAYVQVAVDGSGKKIRNLVLARVVLDGNPPANGDTNVYMQTVALVDAEGRLVQPDGDWQDQMLDEVKKTNELLTLLLDQLR